MERALPTAALLVLSKAKIALRLGELSPVENVNFTTVVHGKMAA
jgi:hypothetical protein